MFPLANALVRTGLALKVHQVKRATESYVRDRSQQGQGIAVSYAVAAGLYAAAGIFLVATLLVGVAALFYWMELRYGLFPALGGSAGMLIVLAIIFAALAAARLKRPTRQFPSLSSRLRVAIKASPVGPAGSASQRSAPATSKGVPTSVETPLAFKPSRPPQHVPANGREAKAGLVLAAALAGWALARRRTLSRNAAVGRTVVRVSKMAAPGKSDA